MLSCIQRDRDVFWSFICAVHFFSQPFNFKNLILALYFINVELNVLAVCLHRVDLLRSHFVCPDISCCILQLHDSTGKLVISGW